MNSDFLNLSKQGTWTAMSFSQDISKDAPYRARYIEICTLLFFCNFFRKTLDKHGSCFHSKKAEYIMQEIYARIILCNYCEILTMHVVSQQKDTKHTFI